jgi:dsRNA-specific ribonuclease
MHALSLENYKELEDKIGYHFKNPHYLQTALTHRSYQNSRENYELLEFLGDSIVNFLVVSFLVENYPHYKEGVLASIKAYLVSEEFLASMAEELELDKYVRISGKRRTVSSSVLSDLFEALLGAIYMDSGGDMNSLKKLFLERYKEKMKGSYRKRSIQKRLQNITTGTNSKANGKTDPSTGW